MTGLNDKIYTMNFMLYFFENEFAETYLQYEKQAFFLNTQPQNGSETVELLSGGFNSFLA